ncbi:probable hexosyltransferase MUCI70 isoform X1 [Zingiber officinale]|uniref:probable hexosyltransferase MUCI70 isoform X1 n=1 Tax=Zingiber officinale TaxID=94328 RepID=UPI001C4C0C6B|nr:probable hexosyltransferase MUCI70 isoform X1 [Zingiber officinale]
MKLFGGVGEPSLRGRRARRLLRTWRRRGPLLFFSLSLLSIVYLSFFGAKLPFDSHQSNTSLENESFTNVTHVWNDREDEIYKRPRPKARKHHGPCEVGLMESVDNIVEPETYMNFTQFSLQYIAKEDTSYGKDVFEARFGGHQTLEQREESFYAKNQTIHCGFIEVPEGHPSTGFELSDKDKEHMTGCRVVVSSCIFGNSDFLRRPTSSKISTFSKKNVCFMMFLDELTLKKLSSEGHIPDAMGNIGLWRIIVVKHLPYADLRKTGKVPKFLSHRLFPSARYSIWLDSKMRLHTDPMLILEYFLWRTRSEYAISNHYDRHCVWEEVLQNKLLNKYNHTVIDEQFMFYQSDGLVKFIESNFSSILPSFVPEGSFIVRAHTPMSNLFSCLWFNEVDRFTSRDQLSFAYTFLKLKRMNPGKPLHLNMFKDCERRAVCKLFHHRVEDINPPPPTPQAL